MKQGLLINRYYQKFGLNRDPFPPKSSQDRLFLTHELTELVDRLMNGIKNQAHVLVVEGPAGAGKSSLADYLNYLKASNWYLSIVEASPQLSETELAHSIISQHFPRHRFDKTQSTVLLKEFLQLYQRNGKLPVVIIDDAHLLPRETLEFILKISELTHEGARFRFVVFAENGARRYLDRACFKDSDEKICEILQMPLFSRSQTLKYLEHRLALAGQSQSDFFNEENISGWFAESAGIPANINRLARQQMKKAAAPGIKLVLAKRAASAMAACLILSVALQAARQLENEDSSTAVSVTRSLQLPASKGLSLKEKPVSDEIKSQAKVVKSGSKVKKQVSGENRKVLLADQKRQQSLRLQKQQEARARRQMRKQIAALDALALRVSDVLQK